MPGFLSRRRFPSVTGCVLSLACGAVVHSEPGRPLELPSHGVPPEWRTKAEATSFRQTPRYDETVAYCKRLASHSDWIEYATFGVSPEGRDLPLVIAAQDGDFTPAAAKAADKPIVLIQNGIHSGECEGKDASMMLLRDIAVTKTRSALLDHVVLVIIPIFNVDGHERFSPYSRINQNGPDEMGWRVTARNLNLNRDYVKADAVEMRAFLRLWNAWRPDLHIDTHTTDGGDWQYDLLYAVDTYATVEGSVAAWLRDVWQPTVVAALQSDGHVPMTYFSLIDSKDPSKGISSGGFLPRYSTGYASIRNRPSILIETHMLKPYRTRVIGQYNMILRTLELINGDPESLKRAVLAADEAVSTWGKSYDPNRQVPLSVRRSGEQVPFVFEGFAYQRELSEISGTTRVVYDNAKPVAIQTTWTNGTEIATAVDPPLAYVIPPQWTEVIELVRLHGLRTDRLKQATELEVESYRFSDVSFSKTPFEGRFRAEFKTERITERRRYKAGSVIVPLDQPDAKVAVHLLEPNAPDSLASWGFFHPIFEQKEYAEHYILEAHARRMLENDPKLREEFEIKVETDKEFAGNPWARLYFFYRRSPYWDARHNIYPVGRLVGLRPWS